MNTERNWAKEIQDEMVKVKVEIQELRRGLIDKEKYLNRLKSMLKSVPRLMVKPEKQSGISPIFYGPVMAMHQCYFEIAVQ